MKTKTQFKQTEMGLLPDDWKIGTIADVSTYVNRGVSPKYTDKGIPVLNQKCIRDGVVGRVDIKQHDPLIRFPEDKILRDFDILVNSTGVGTLGRSASVGDKLKSRTLPDSHLTIVRIDSTKANPIFVSYFLRKIQLTIENLGQGTSGQQELSREQLKNILLPIPPITEQCVIAKLLSSLDSRIELNLEMNKTLEAIGQALFKHWFVDFEFPTPDGPSKGKPYKSSGGTMVESDLGMIPEGWTVLPIDKAANFLNGLALQKYPPEADGMSIPVIKISELHNGVRPSSDRASVNIPSEYVIKDGDLLFSWSGSLEVVIWTGGSGALNQHLFKVTSYKYPRWLIYLWLKEHLNSFRAIASTKATTMGHIQRHHLSEAKIVIPSEDVLNTMSTIIEPMFTAIVNNALGVRSATGLRDILLPKLMSGEIRVPV